MHKKAKKSGLDLNQYNILKRQVAEIEYGMVLYCIAYKLTAPLTHDR